MAAQISALPSPPSRNEPSTFSTKADAFLGALPAFVTQANTLATEAETDAATAETGAISASTSADAAAASAAGAAAAANVTKWISGTTYAEGNNVWSPIDYLTYRRKTNGAGTTDPSQDTTNWVLLLVGSGISNIVTATTATTLPIIKTLLQITPASYGVAVTLPDATTCSEGAPMYIIDNKGAYPVKILNSAGTLLGFVYADVVSHISLIDNATAAGVWSIGNNELVGASAQLLTTNMKAVNSCIALDSDREFLLGNGGSNYSYGVIYKKSTNTFGSVTAIRSAATAGNHIAIKTATDQILVVSCTSGAAAFEAVVLSIAGTAITVNTAATATLSANISNFADGCGLIQVGTSFITSYTVATPAVQIREITISGTTPTISAATVLSGTAGGLIVAGSSTVVIAVSTATTHLYTRPYSIGGLAAGTGTDTNSGTMILNKLSALGSRWYVGYNDGGATVKGGVISLSSTTTTITAATLFSAGTLQDAIVVGTNKVLALNNQSTNNANILTDTAGTASAGTAITISDDTARACILVRETDVMVHERTTFYRVHTVNCSGASPVLSKSFNASLSNTETPGLLYSNSMLSRPSNMVFGSDFAQTIVVSMSTVNFHVRVKGGQLSRVLPKSFAYGGITAYSGSVNSDRWVVDEATVISKVECVQ